MLNLFNRRPHIRSEMTRLEQHDISADLQQRFAAYLEQAADRELYHCNPRYIGEALQLEERPVLKLLLAAVYEGIMTMHWDLRCPACGSPDHRYHRLDDLHRNTQCEMCQSIYDPHIDKEVRMTFSIHERLRALPERANDKAFRAEIDERLGPVAGLSMLTLSDFQRLFPQQRLPPDESLDITRIALVFTDLAGSTALYARRGDPRAYHLVHLHFQELFRVADMYSGMVVKTIGDAILATFQTPHEALCAALQMQNAIAELNNRRQLVGEERLILKVGVHSGPCISVTLNERPDYFGTTVNTAARVQGLSKGNDIVFTDAISTDPEAAGLLEGRKLESSEVALKGIENRTRVYYLPLQEVPSETLAV